MKANDIMQKIMKIDNLRSYDAIIHVGSPKTGSSALQNLLVNHREELLKEGYYYPFHGLDENGISAGHIEVSVPMLLGKIDKSKNKFREYMNEAKKNNSTLLISSESFYSNPEKLLEIVTDYNVKIVCFFRDPFDAVFSNYNQGVKRHSYVSSVGQYINDVIKSDLSYYNGELFESWEYFFGSENILIVGYDTSIFKVIGIEEFFLRLLNISEEAIDSIKPKSNKYINKSYTLAALEFKRVLNYVIEKDNMYKLNRELDWFLQNISDKAENEYKLYNLLPASLLLKLEDCFKESNEIMKKKHLFNINATFLSPNKRTLKEVSSYEVLKEILDIIDTMKKEKTHLYEYIKEMTLNNINSMQPGHDVLKLAEWLDIRLQSNYSIFIWFNQQQVDYFTRNESKKEDILREIAKLFVQMNDYPNAHKIIEEAIRLKPHASGIINLQKQIKKQLGII